LHGQINDDELMKLKPPRICVLISAYRTPLLSDLD